MKRATLFHAALLAGLFVALPTIATSQLFWNQAASFAGNANSYIAVPNSSSLNITGSFTIEAWVRPTNRDNPTFQVIVNKRAGSANEGFNMYLDSGRVAIRTNSSTRLRGTTKIPDDIWTHVAATYDATGGVFTVYVNGSSNGTVTIAAAAPLASTDSLTIGKGFNDPFNGWMDDIRLWNRALTSTEIRNNRRTALGANSGVYDGLVMSMMFQSSVNNTSFNLFDSSAKGNSGTNRGATVVNLANRPYNYTTFNDCVNLDGTADYLSREHNCA